MSHHQINLDPRKLLTAVVENLNGQFFADGRAETKRLYKSISSGEEVPFIRIDFGDSGEVLCNLDLDHSQYCGDLNYGKFRKCLAMMLQGITVKLRDNTGDLSDLNILQSDSGELLFNIPGMVNSDEGINVLVCGLRQQGPGLVTIRLMFLDPSQYVVEE